MTVLTPQRAPVLQIRQGSFASFTRHIVRGTVMAKRRWTLVLVPHGAEPSRIVEVSYGVLRVAASAAAGLPGSGSSCRLRHRLPYHRPLAHRQAAAGKRDPGPRNRRAQRPPLYPGRYPYPDLPARCPNPGARQPRADRSPGAGGRNRRSGWCHEPRSAGHDRHGSALGGGPDRSQRADSARQPAGFLVQGSGRQPGLSTPLGSPPRRRSCRPRAGSPARSPRCELIRFCTTPGRMRAST